MYRLLAKLDNGNTNYGDFQTDFLVSECGHYKIIKQPDYSLYRVHGRKDYQLLYVAQGCAYFVLEGVNTPAKAGDFIIYGPDYPQRYHYHQKDNTDLYWMHFYGTETDGILRQLNLATNQVLSSQFDSYITKKWIQIIHELALQLTGFQILCPLYAREILTLISRRTSPVNEMQRKSQHIIINAIEYISNEFAHTISISQLARHLGVSVCWLNQNFKTYTGTSPLQYAINMRLSHSKDLLRFSDYTIAEIARMCGYEDSLYFSRLFRKHEKCSPREYRNQG